MGTSTNPVPVTINRSISTDNAYISITEWGTNG
jgi:hypothetical protein